MTKPHLPKPGEKGPGFRFSSLSSEDRIDIVSLTADFSYPGAAYAPARRLSLSALGADAEILGAWDEHQVSLVGWHHVATSGRDHYVKVTNRGYLFPLGHQAVQITIVERVLGSDPAHPGGWSNAFLRLRQYIKVIAPTKDYPALGQPFAGRSWPFRRAQITSLVTPPIVLKDLGSKVSEIDLAGAPFLWSVTLTDLDGRIHAVRVPLLFMLGLDVPNGMLRDEFKASDVAPVATLYNALPRAQRTIDLGGRHLRLAPEPDDHPGIATHPTLSITLEAATSLDDPTVPGATAPGAPSNGALQAERQPAFYPVLGSARLQLPAADALSRSSFSTPGGSGTAIGLFPRFVRDGSNAGGVYAQLVDEASPHQGSSAMLQFPGDAVGGLGTPNIGVSGLSSTTGVVAGSLDALATQGHLTADDYFGGATGDQVELPQLLGGRNLGDVLAGFTGGAPSISNLLDPATGVRTVTYELDATLAETPLFVPLTAPGKLVLRSVTTIALGSPPSTAVDGTLDAFRIQIAGDGALHLLDITFATTHFHAVAGTKTSFTPEVTEVAFAGALEFVNTLQEIIAEYFGGSGFDVEVLPTQVSVGTSVELPSVTMGMFSLEHLGIALKLALPFTGAPAVASFSFASHEKPFIVTVSMFGGGGYVALGVGLSQIQSVSCDFDIAASLSLDVGVASGSISAKAGFGLLYDVASGTTLTGFLHINGSLEFLGVVSLTVELDLELSYQVEAKILAGTASLEVDIEVAFFSVSVGFTLHREISVDSGIGTNAVNHALGSGANAGGRILMGDLVTDAAQWSTYCSAFA